MRRARGALLVALLCAACGAHKRPSVPSDKLWTKGDQAMQDEAWDVAVQNYKSLLDQYPFDPNAEDAELKIAEAYYNAGRYPEAIAAFGDFERMHPTSDNLAQIEYRRGMSYLAQHRIGDRDQQSIKNAPMLPERRGSLSRQRLGRQGRAAPARVPPGAGRARRRHRRVLPQAGQPARRGGPTARPAGRTTRTPMRRRRPGSSRRRTPARDEPEEANLALATLARHHPDSPLGRSAREKLGALDPAGGQDRFRSWCRGSTSCARKRTREVPRPVSAYSDRPGMPGGRGYEARDPRSRCAAVGPLSPLSVLAPCAPASAQRPPVEPQARARGCGFAPTAAPPPRRPTREGHRRRSESAGVGARGAACCGTPRPTRRAYAEDAERRGRCPSRAPT